MFAREAIRDSINNSDFIVTSYLSDLEDSELVVRPVPGANHIAWQLGHLISSEHEMIETTCPGSMPPLPHGFSEQHRREAAQSDDPAAFRKKQEYLDLYRRQRAATVAALMNLTDDDLDDPAPEAFRGYVKNLGGVFSIQSGHWLMHAGQWAVIRRKLGRPPLF